MTGKFLLNIDSIIKLMKLYSMNNLFSTNNYKEIKKLKYKCLICNKKLNKNTAWTVKWNTPFDKNTYCKNCALKQTLINNI